MAANIRTVNEFPPKFAHHVTLTRLLRGSRRRGDRPRSRLPAIFWRRKKLPRTLRVQARSYFTLIRQQQHTPTIWHFHVGNILPAGCAHKNVYSGQHSEKLRKTKISKTNLFRSICFPCRGAGLVSNGRHGLLSCFRVLQRITEEHPAD